jgi:hypothetical protein
MSHLRIFFPYALLTGPGKDRVEGVLPVVKYPVAKYQEQEISGDV